MAIDPDVVRGIGHRQRCLLVLTVILPLDAQINRPWQSRSLD
jgi:hypothetical protein